ncbi:translesion error-prone DNA polymerase V subunit UmuC, partial [Enterobacter sp.]
MFALVDVNSFYVSCETAFRPDLWGKPVVVLSNNDGCVIARNSEAKRLNVVMGAPFFKQKDLFRANNVTCFSSNYELYADMSKRVMDTLEAMCPGVEMYSIDEAFCDLTGVRNCCDLEDFGHAIRQSVKLNTHLQVGVGIAQTKTLAKLANYAAKRWSQTGGVVDLSNQARQRKLMAALPVGEVWGIGGRLAKKLDAMGIKTILQLADADIRFIRKHFSVVVERTVRELRGESCLAFDEFIPLKQEIVCSRS